MKPGRFANNKSTFYSYLEIVKVINSFYLVLECQYFFTMNMDVDIFCPDVSTIKIKREHYTEFSYSQCLGEGCRVGQILCEQNKRTVLE